MAIFLVGCARHETASSFVHRIVIEKDPEAKDRIIQGSRQLRDLARPELILLAYDKDPDVRSSAMMVLANTEHRFQGLDMLDYVAKYPPHSDITSRYHLGNYVKDSPTDARKIFQEHAADALPDRKLLEPFCFWDADFVARELLSGKVARPSREIIRSIQKSSPNDVIIRALDRG